MKSQIFEFIYVSVIEKDGKKGKCAYCSLSFSGNDLGIKGATSIL